MTKPPARKTIQDDWIKTALRLPRDLHAELQAGADINAQSLNAEILQRLQLRQHQAVMDELAEVKAMLRKLMDMT